jgi:diaminopropionate ammonia-lyase
VPAAPDGPVAFHRELPGYQPTPLRSLPGLADELGLGQVLVKDESSRLGLSSFKVLGASWAIERTLREKPHVTALIAASAGNHGLAVAHTAAERGLGCLIYLPAGAAQARVEHIAATGARLVLVDGDYDDAVAAAASAADNAVLIADVSADPAAETPRWVVDGYSTLFAELAAQLDGQVDVLLVPAGVGSLAAAATSWAVHFGRGTKVIAVEPETAACVGAALAAGQPVRVPTPGTTMAGLDCGAASAVAWPVLRDGLTGALPVSDSLVHAAMRDLARPGPDGPGLAIGDCGAAPVAALRELMTRYDRFRELAGLHPRARVVLLATEGVTDPDSYRTIVAAGQRARPRRSPGR